MTGDDLRAMQAPVKARYKENPASARLTLKAQGTLSADTVNCQVKTGLGVADAGLHPATGGDGKALCSGDMLLEALVGCAGVTLRAVAAAMGIPFRKGTVTAEGDMDFRGTLGVSKEVPVGFQEIRLKFDIDADATPEQIESLKKLAERYCVVYQTLKNAPTMKTDFELKK